MNGNLWWIGYKTIVRKEITRILRIWGQTIVPPAITMSLYFIIFGELIGRRIGEMGGFTYMQYIVPGLVIMSVITNSYGNMVSSFFGAKFGKHIGMFFKNAAQEHRNRMAKNNRVRNFHHRRFQMQRKQYVLKFGVFDLLIIKTAKRICAQISCIHDIANKQRCRSFELAHITIFGNELDGRVSGLSFGYGC